MRDFETGPGSGSAVENGQIAREARAGTGIYSGRSLAQILIVMLVLLVLVNVPLGVDGFGLAHLMPANEALVIEEGMLFKGSGRNIYVMEAHRLRRIASPEASSRYFSIERAQPAADQMLAQFGQGPPIRHLATCKGQPEVYALDLERGWKQRVERPQAGPNVKPWDRVHMVSCSYLSRLQDGPAISGEAEGR